MLGIAVQLALSWLVLWFACRRHLDALGLLPTRRRLLDLAFGLTLAALACGLTFGLGLLIRDVDVARNPNYTASHFWGAAGWHLRSVLFEELIFRGALLFILIRKLGVWKACAISATAFGIYHWFSMGALGQPVQMLILFLFTGFYGLLFAVSFAWSGSLYLPVALHFGWNLVQAVAFSPGKGEQLLTVSGGHLVSPVVFASPLLIPFVAVPLALAFYLRRRATGARRAPGTA